MSAAQPITAEDLGAALAGFALGLAASIKDPRKQTPNDMLETLANELHSLVKGMKLAGDQGTPAAEALALTANMLMASEVGR